MDIEESKMFLESRVPETPAKTSVPNEEINLTVRRRNEKTNVVCIEDNDLDSTGRACPDKISVSAEANSDDTSSRIPSITYVDSPSKQNGSLSRENDDDLYDCNLGDTRVLTQKERIKLSNIQSSIVKSDTTVEDLELLGCTAEGLVNDDIRRVLWPKLLRLSDENNVSTSELETIHERVQNDVYQQILKDVARSNSHMSENATQEEIDRFHKELTQLICWVLHRHSALKSVWFLNSVNWKAITHVMLSGIGYNDIAATVLLVMGLESGLSVLESISLKFLERFMEKTMEKVNQELYFIFALLERVHPTLLEHLENVELFPHFALAEYTTWYAHKYAENRKLLHRLFDYFLGSPPLMPLYLSTVIVACRAAEIFNTTPDMGHTHKVLCTLPDDLPFESLLIEATELYRQYPPKSISNDVKEYDYKRKCKEQEWKAKAEASRQERKRQRKLRIVPWTPRIPYRIRSYKTITAVTILALGIYAFLKSSSGLN